jgi:hypothetical protein
MGDTLFMHLWPLLHPPLDCGSQRLGNPTWLAWCPAELSAIQALFLILLEPEAYRGAMDPQILGDGFMLTTPTRHQHRLAPVTEASISGGLEHVFQFPLFRCRESDPPHLVLSPLHILVTQN